MQTRNRSQNINLDDFINGRLGKIQIDHVDNNKYRYSLIDNKNVVETWIIQNNQKNGFNILYNNGIVTRTSNWKNDLLEGEQKFYQSNYVDKIEYYDKGQIKKRIEYYLFDKIKSIIIFNYGEIINRENYDELGNIIPMDLD